MPTDPPRSILGWALEVFVLLAAGSCVVAIGGVLWALHMRERHVIVQQATCRSVVFGAQGKSWTYAPEPEECPGFVVGSLWLIEVNDLGTVRPKRKE